VIPNRHATRAYQAASEHRSLRDQEADVFRRATSALRMARDSGPLPRARTIADNARLWMLVTSLIQDPANQLPKPLRAQIASIGAAVQRELDAPEPDFDFVIGINEHIAAGLSGAPLP